MTTSIATEPLTRLAQPFSAAEVAAIRADFPVLTRTVRDGRPLVYLDSGATSQKPNQVLDAERTHYEVHNAAVHRGVHQLADEATEAFESARERIAAFVGAPAHEIVFTKNATESINLLAYALSNAGAPGALDGVPDAMAARLRIVPGDEIVVTEMEHHANLVPWQELCRRTGATLRWFALTDDGRLDLSELTTLITERTRLVAWSHQSNVLGTINEIEPIAARAREVGALTVLDGCQSVPHMPVDVGELGVDAVTFSGHKMFGPTGIGVLWARAELLAALPPFLTGGSMIEQVFMDHSTFAPPPQRFEAGSMNVAQAVGLAAACDYLRDLGMDRVHAHEVMLTGYLLERLARRPWIRLVGPADLRARGGAVSFVVEWRGETVHAHDVGQILDAQGIAVRVGHHCAWPLHRRFRAAATTRVTFAAYNSTDDVDAFLSALDDVPRVFRLEV